MKRFIEGKNRFQSTLFPESLEDYIAKDNSIRIVDAFVDKLNLVESTALYGRPDNYDEQPLTTHIGLSTTGPTAVDS